MFAHMGEGNWKVARKDRPVMLIDRAFDIGNKDNPPPRYGVKAAMDGWLKYGGTHQQVLWTGDHMNRLEQLCRIWEIEFVAVLFLIKSRYSNVLFWRLKGEINRGYSRTAVIAPVKNRSASSN